MILGVQAAREARAAAQRDRLVALLSERFLSAEPLGRAVRALEEPHCQAKLVVTSSVDF